MPKFSDSSLDKLMTCHKDVQDVFFEVIKYFDCTILEGNRSFEQQQKYVRSGRSKTMKSKHLPFPSMAVDAVPYPIDWEDTERMALFIGFVLGVAEIKGIKLRSGIDWDSDTQTNDTTFKDYPHFELMED